MFVEFFPGAIGPFSLVQFLNVGYFHKFRPVCSEGTQFHSPPLDNAGSYVIFSLSKRLSLSFNFCYSAIDQLKQGNEVNHGNKRKYGKWGNKRNYKFCCCFPIIIFYVYILKLSYLQVIPVCLQTITSTTRPIVLSFWKSK